MSTEFSEEEWQKMVNFLTEFTINNSTEEESQPLPLRVTPTSVGQVELPGCLINWTLECLHKCNCPDVLAAILTHHATKEILDSDLSDHRFEESEDLDMAKLTRVVFNNIQNICSKWEQETPKLYKPQRSYPTCVHAIKNTRRKMEDKHVVLPYFNSLFGLNKGYPDLAFFAVYDGHGGSDAAIYTSVHLHCFLAKNKSLSTDPGLALHETFLMTDESFEAKAKAEGLRSGCTAVTVLISSDKMYLAWLGDSQVVLCKAGESITLMEPHKPENQDERQRIESLGGCVVYFGAWRVNGSLSVSRAIGDVEHKPFISGEPFVAEYTFEGDEEFLVLACDGLWDTVGKDQAIQLVKNNIAEGNSRDSAAKLLVDAAKDAGSNDNISVVVVYLDAHISSAATEKGSISLSTSEEINTSHNGTLKCNNLENLTSNSLPLNGKDTCKKDGPHVHIVETDAENHDSIVAKVKICSENSRTSDKKNVTCRVTSEKYNSEENTSGVSSERTTKSADNSPKQRRKGKGEKSSNPVQSSKGFKSRKKSPHQLGIDQNDSSRRRSAPGAFTSS